MHRPDRTIYEPQLKAHRVLGWGVHTQPLPVIHRHSSQEAQKIDEVAGLADDPPTAHARVLGPMAGGNGTCIHCYDKGFRARHRYSVPQALVGQLIEARLTAHAVELLHRGQRVAAHARSAHKGGFTTVLEHLPVTHRAHLQWTPERLIDWGQSIGVATGRTVERLLVELLEQRGYGLVQIVHAAKALVAQAKV